MCIVAVLSFEAQLALKTKILSAVAVSSATMCIAKTATAAAVLRYSKETVHVGDLVIFRDVISQALKTSCPDSDIIVFRKPGKDRLLVI